MEVGRVKMREEGGEGRQARGGVERREEARSGASCTELKSRGERTSARRQAHASAL